MFHEDTSCLCRYSRIYWNIFIKWEPFNGSKFSIFTPKSMLCLIVLVDHVSKFTSSKGGKEHED